MAKAEEMKTTLEPIQNPRKLEGYESLVGYINYQQKDYKGAVDHFEKTNMQDMYNKYWLAKAYEAAGKKDKATALYKEIANYNFNNIGYALVRNEVKKKI
jgi:tetratricopeptide (TPR) repeat protein